MKQSLFDTSVYSDLNKHFRDVRVKTEIFNQDTTFIRNKTIARWDIVSFGGGGVCYLKDSFDYESLNNSPVIFTSFYEELFSKDVKIIKHKTLAQCIKLYEELKDSCYGMIFKPDVTQQLTNPFNVVTCFTLVNKEQFLLDYYGDMYLYPKRDVSELFVEFVNNGKLGSYRKVHDKLNNDIFNVLTNSVKISTKTNNFDDSISPKIKNINILDFYGNTHINNLNNLEVIVRVQTENRQNNTIESDTDLSKVIASVGILNNNIFYPYYGAILMQLDNLTNLTSTITAKSINLTPLRSNNIKLATKDISLREFLKNSSNPMKDYFNIKVLVLMEKRDITQYHDFLKVLDDNQTYITNLINNIETASSDDKYEMIDKLIELDNGNIGAIAVNNNQLTYTCFGNDPSIVLKTMCGRMNHYNRSSAYSPKGIQLNGAVDYITSSIDFCLEKYKEIL